MKKFIALALLSFPCFAQVVTLTVDSPWTVFGSGVKHTFAAVPLQLNSVGNLTAISGQRVAIGELKFQQSSVSVTFKGPALSSTTGFRVVGIRAYHEMSALSMSMPEHAINWLFHEPLLVPPGEKMTCRYDMPLIGFGALICAIGTVVPGPVVIPPPPPPPTTGVSAPDSKAPPLSQLVATDGAIWTLVSGQALRNGANTNNPYSPGIQYLYVSPASTIRSLNSNGTYQCWTGSAWAGSGC
jgi:hypothetical protein